MKINNKKLENAIVEVTVAFDKEEWKEKYNYEIIIGNGKTMVERMFEWEN